MNQHIRNVYKQVQKDRLQTVKKLSFDKQMAIKSFGKKTVYEATNKNCLYDLIIRQMVDRCHTATETADYIRRTILDKTGLE